MRNRGASGANRSTVALTNAASAAAVALLALVGTAGPAAASPTWSSPHVVATNLNAGGVASVNAVSCPASGDCVSGGSYVEGKATNAFVDTEQAGHFSPAQSVAASLNTGGAAEVATISCSSPGDCAAGGSYMSSLGTEAFAVTEIKGKWGVAQELAASVNTGDDAYVTAISCTGPGDCTAGGSYQLPTGGQAFVDKETNGHWAPIVTVAHALNTGLSATVTSVSCTSSGECAAGGQYTPGSPGSSDFDPFVVAETNGHWGAAQEVATNLNTKAEGYVTSISCTASGICAAAGAYTGSVGQQGFLVSEVHGHWRIGLEVPGSPPNPSDFPVVATSIS